MNYIKRTVLLSLATLLLFGCSPAKDDDTQPSSPDTSDVSVAPDTNSSKITEEQAVQLLHNLFGDENEETGFSYSYGIAGTHNMEGQSYYVLRLSWLVTDEDGNPSHSSYLSTFLIAEDGSVIYEADQTDYAVIGDAPFWTAE